jgi:hypothetical protein
MNYGSEVVKRGFPDTSTLSAIPSTNEYCQHRKVGLNHLENISKLHSETKPGNQGALQKHNSIVPIDHTTVLAGLGWSLIPVFAFKPQLSG